MLTRNICRILLLVLLSPTATLALGLGDIHLKSALNSPLDADIDIVGASPDELAGLKATLASRDTFNRYRIEYPSFLAGVRLEPRQTADGRTVLHLQSSDAVNEPIATMLVEVNWARGHLVREYTVLLDPPVFTGQNGDSSGNGAATAVAAPTTGDTARSGSVERRSASPAPAAAMAASVAATPSAGPAVTRVRSASAATDSSGAASTAATPNASSYTVRNGDTLSSITAQVYGPGDHVSRAARAGGGLSRQHRGIRRQYECIAVGQSPEHAGRVRTHRHQPRRGGSRDSSPVFRLEPGARQRGQRIGQRSVASGAAAGGRSQDGADCTRCIPITSSGCGRRVRRNCGCRGRQCSAAVARIPTGVAAGGIAAAAADEECRVGRAAGASARRRHRRRARRLRLRPPALRRHRRRPHLHRQPRRQQLRPPPRHRRRARRLRLRPRRHPSLRPSRRRHRRRAPLSWTCWCSTGTCLPRWSPS